MTPEQRTALQQLAAQFPQFDRAVQWANGDESRPVVGPLPPALQDKWSVFDKYRIDKLRALANLASIANGDFDSPVTVESKLDTWWATTTQAQKNAVLLGLIKFSIADLMDKMKNAQAADTVDLNAGKVELGDTWAITNGFPNGITEDLIREAVKQ